MTIEEVEEIIGIRPGHYRTQDDFPLPAKIHFLAGVDEQEDKAESRRAFAASGEFMESFWNGNEACIRVGFDSSGRARTAACACYESSCFVRKLIRWIVGEE